MATKPAWVSTNPNSGSGNGKVTVTAQQNTSNFRSGSVTISGSGATKKVNVSQAAQANLLTITELDFRGQSMYVCNMRDFPPDPSMALKVGDKIDIQDGIIFHANSQDYDGQCAITFDKSPGSEITWLLDPTVVVKDLTRLASPTELLVSFSSNTGYEDAIRWGELLVGFDQD